MAAPEVFNEADHEAEYLKWVAEHPRGFVLNTNRPKPSPTYLILHSAACRSIAQLAEGHKRFTSGGYQKICSAERRDVESWARSKAGIAPTACRICLG